MNNNQKAHQATTYKIDQSKVQRPTSFVYEQPVAQSTEQSGHEDVQLSESTTDETELTAQTGELAAALAKLATSNMNQKSSEVPDVNDLLEQLTKGVRSPALAQQAVDEEDGDSDLKEQADGMSLERKMEELIRSQSQAIVEGQKNQQKNPPISKAAAALNQAELGTTDDDDSEGSNTEMMSVSHDQFVLSEKQKNDQQRDAGEPAAISAAKEAVHALAQNSKESEPDQEHVALETEQSAELDASTLEEIQQKAEMDDETSQLAQEAAEKGVDEDLSVPDWPKYPDPHKQRDQIEAELAQVQKEAAVYQKLAQQNEMLMRDSKRKSLMQTGDYEAEDTMLTAQHRSTVSHIKSEIWSDRVSFLQKVLRLADDEDREAEQADLPKATHKRQSLSQDDSDEDEEELEPSEDSDDQFDADAELEKELTYEAQDEDDLADDSEGKYRGLTDKEWDRRAETEKTHLSELESKAKELDKAQEQVHQAQALLQKQKRKIDDEIQAENKELQAFREELDMRAQEREEAEAKAKKERERLYTLAHQEEADKKQQKIAETEKIQHKAKKLHEKQKQLSQQKETVKDAKYEVSEEIQKLRDDIRYSDRALRIARRMKQRIDDHEVEEMDRGQYMAPAHHHEHRKAHEEEWDLIHDQDKAAKHLVDKHVTCPEAKVEKGACGQDGFRISKVTHFTQVGNECKPKMMAQKSECSVVEAMDFINAHKKKKDDWVSYDNRDEDEDPEEPEDDETHFKDLHRSHSQRQSHQVKDEDEQPMPKAKDIDKPKSYNGNDIDEIDEQVFYLGQKKSSSDEWHEASKEAYKSLAQSNIKQEEVQTMSAHLGSIEQKVAQIAGEYARLKKESASKDEQLKKVQATQAALEKERQVLLQQQQKSQLSEQQHHTEMEELKAELHQKLELNAGNLDKEQVARLAGMLKTLAQYKSVYKEAIDDQERQAVKGKASDFTLKWLDEKLLQLGATDLN